MHVKQLDLDLLPTLKKVDARAKRKILSRVLEGTWTAMLKGRGMEFAGFRKYTYGDDASMIDWGATLRSKDTLIKEFEEYKNITVFIVLDVSDNMLFSSTSKMKAEHAAELSFNLAAAILDNGDAVGFAMVNNDIVAKVQAGIGKEVLYRMASELQKPENYGGKSSLKAAVSVIEGFLNSKALIILISDFTSLEEGWERYIKMIAQKHDLIGLAIKDPRDRTLPSLGAQVLVEDAHTREKLYIDTKKYSQQYDKEAREDELKIRSVFEKAHAGFLLVETGGDPYAPLLSYFRKRAAIMK